MNTFVPTCSVACPATAIVAVAAPPAVTATEDANCYPLLLQDIRGSDPMLDQTDQDSLFAISVVDPDP